MSEADKAAQSAEDAADAARDAAVSEATAEALETAQARIAEAENTARAVTDAMLQTEMGREIAGVKTEVAKCLNDLAAMRISQTEVITRLESLSASLLTRETPQTVVVSSSTRPLRSETVEGVEPETLAQSNGDAGDRQEAEKASQRPRRRII